MPRCARGMHADMACNGRMMADWPHRARSDAFRSGWNEPVFRCRPERLIRERFWTGGFPRFRGKPRFRPMTHETTETAPRIEMGTWMPSPHPVLSLPVRTVSFSRKPKKRKRRESEKHTGFAPSHLASHHLVCRNAVYPHVSESLPQNGRMATSPSTGIIRSLDRHRRHRRKPSACRQAGSGRTGHPPHSTEATRTPVRRCSERR